MKKGGVLRLREVNRLKTCPRLQTPKLTTRGLTDFLVLIPRRNYVTAAKKMLIETALTCCVERAELFRDLPENPIFQRYYQHPRFLIARVWVTGKYIVLVFFGRFSFLSDSTLPSKIALLLSLAAAAAAAAV